MFIFRTMFDAERNAKQVNQIHHLKCFASHSSSQSSIICLLTSTCSRGNKHQPLQPRINRTAPSKAD